MSNPTATKENYDTTGDRPPPLEKMFINSTDTLKHREIPQTVPSEWNDKPPLFLIKPSSTPSSRLWGLRRGGNDGMTQDEEDSNLLKGMIRKGIPGPLRCAVWLSNIIQSSYPHQSPSEAHAYRTLAKVQILDHAYQTLLESNSLKDDAAGLHADFGNSTIWKRVQDCPGSKSMDTVLYALSHVLGGGIECAPMIPTLAMILLNYMSESYVFCALREMTHHPTWFLAISESEHVAYQSAFLAILGKLHPNTVETLKEKGFEDTYTQAIFRDFFCDLLPEPHVHRIMDIFTLEGNKCLFRFGVALAVMYHREWKEKYIYELGTTWWDGLLKFSHSETFPFDLIVKKAYGVHGRGIRQRYRFPRRPIIARIIQLEEERYWKQKLQLDDLSEDFPSELVNVQPLGLVPSGNPVVPDGEPVFPILAKSTIVRKKLAEWLPLSLRFTKLELMFSTNHHGRTLENLYRSVAKARRTIMLVEPLSTKKEMVIGMFAPQTWHPSPRVYGDGSCFLFRIDPKDPEASVTKCWKWHPRELDHIMSMSSEDGLEAQGSHHSAESNNATALLEQFQVSTANYMSMGGNSNGTAGLRLNEDLTKGQSSPAAGFDNEPLAGDFFEIGLVEVYQMVREIDGRPVH